MALETVPWFVGGGAEHSPDVARMVAYAATSGGAGVLGVGDFRVTPLPVPGTSVRIAAGSAAIPNGYLAAPDYGKQSYIARAASVTDVPVTATGSSGGRVDLVILRVDDPQYGGQLPADVKVGPYNRFAIIENVTPGSTELPADLGYPAIPLARLDIPASTGTIQASHITSLRKMPTPRTSRDLITIRPTVTEDLTSTAFVNFPSQSSTQVKIPTWASRVTIKGDVSGVYMGTGPTGCHGELRTNLGGIFSNPTYYDFDLSAGQGYGRYTIICGDTSPIPEWMRGTTQTLSIQGRKVAGTGKITSQTPYTFASLDIEFTEVPD